MLFRKQKNYLFSHQFFFAQKHRLKFFNLNFTIEDSNVGKTFLVYSGNIFIPLKIKEKMVGFQLKDFIFSKKRAIFKKIVKNISKKNKKK
jgi:ribosomal protein S19